MTAGDPLTLPELQALRARSPRHGPRTDMASGYFDVLRRATPASAG